MAAENHDRHDPDPVFLALLSVFEGADGYADDEENTLLFYFADALIDIYVLPEDAPIVRVIAVLLDPLGAPDPGEFVDPAEWRAAVVARTIQSAASTNGEVSAWCDAQSNPDGSLGVMYLGPGGPRRFAPAVTFEVPIGVVEPESIRDYLSEFAMAWAARSIANPPQIQMTGRSA
jgi:hypothetical protein